MLHTVRLQRMTESTEPILLEDYESVEKTICN